DTFQPGKTYSFAVNAMYKTGGSEEKFKLTLQYNDGTGAQYSEVASASTTAGDWVQLANPSYTIPEGASDLQLYVETVDTDIDFYIDEAAAAKSGTEIKGADGPKTVILGDANFDGAIDSFDLVTVRNELIAGNASGSDLKASDVDQNGKLETADLVLIQSFVIGKLSEWPEPPEPEKPEYDTSKWDNYKETASAQYIEFYKSSIKHMGNTYRLTQKLAAAESGQPLTIAYLGGSITEGKNYSSPFSNYLRTTFAKGSFKEVNAGMSGTSSVVGLVRSEKDIVSQKPDIIFLEFSVNDHEDIMYKKCFESCIKKFLDMPNEPAVGVIITRSKGGFSSQSQMYPIGKNFDIPVISMDDALTKAFNSKFLQTSDYYTDEYHPHQKGGQLVADCMAYYIRQALKTENQSAGYTQPTKYVYGAEYASCVNVDPKTLTNFNAGSWNAGKGYNSLPYSYTLNGGSPMKFKTQGKGFIVVFKANSSGMGSINVTVNGKTTKINGNKQYTWGGPDAELGYYQNTTGDLDVSITGSGSFTIWGIGLIK
ncbi:MAG: carbohydrate binding domain-containing protein, partial [Ruminococcus sp.]|nr:carbohydrate binding domain-containing protein [Ruminococcus sp.]